MSDSPPKIDRTLDITLDICPMTFVKTKLELEEMELGEFLEVLVRQGEPLDNVSRSCDDEGHRVHVKELRDGEIWRLVIERGPM